MLRDEFKERYTTIPFAVYRAYCNHKATRVISHHHKEIELISLTEGNAFFYVDEQGYRLEKGDILIIPPYSVHRAEISSVGITSYDCICFDLDLIWDSEIKTGLISHTLSVINMIHKNLPYSEKLSECIAMGCLACEKGESGWELEAIGNMSLFFGILKKNGCFTFNLRNKTENTFAQQVLEYIADNYAKEITSTNVSSIFYMNPSCFCRKFKKTFGCCFSDYVLAYRLEKAKIYLRTTNLNITEIAFRTGFNGCSYFGKAFKEQYGLSPFSYRKSDLYK